MIKKLFYILFLLILPTCIKAGEETNGFKIKTISTGWQGADIYIWPTQSVLADGCTTPSFRMSTDHPLKDEIISLLLSAYHANSTVKVYVNGCINGAMKLQAVKLEK